MNPETKPQKPLSARIAERMKEQLEGLGMGILPAGVTPHLIMVAEAEAEKAAFAYIDALNQKRVVKAISEVFCPRQREAARVKASVSTGGERGAAPQKGSQSAA